MTDLMNTIQNKFKEEISSEIFSIIDLLIKEISYELTPFKGFCHCFFVVDEVDLLILVQFVAEFLLTIVMLQEK